MLTRTIAIIFGVAALAVINALISHPRNGDIIGAKLTAPLAASPPIDTRTTPSGLEPDVSVSEFVEQMPFAENAEKKAMVKAWKRVPKHDRYRAARTLRFKRVVYDYGEIAGAYGLALFVVDTSRTEPQRFGVVVILRRHANHFDVYWVYRDQDLSNFGMSRASGSIFIEYPREDGTRTNCRIQWVRKKARWTCE